MTPTCETSAGYIACGQPATHLLRHRVAGISAYACDTHTARWLRTKKRHGVVYRVNPGIVAIPLTPQAIQQAYDAGDTTLGQELNRLVGIARGGSPESGGAVR